MFIEIRKVSCGVFDTIREGGEGGAGGSEQGVAIEQVEQAAVRESEDWKRRRKSSKKVSIVEDLNCDYSDNEHLFEVRMKTQNFLTNMNFCLFLDAGLGRR